MLDSLQIGGLENGLVNLLNRLDENKYTHTICCLRRVGPMAQRISRNDVEVICLESHGRDYAMPLRLSRIMKRLKPNIVHTRNWGTVDGILAARLAGIRNTVHGEHGKDFNEVNRRLWKRAAFRRIMDSSVTRYVTVSKDLKAWLISEGKISDQKILTIMNGVDTSRFFPPRDRTSVKSKLGFAPNTFLVGAIGRLDKVKNYKLALNASIVLKKSGFQHSMVFIGDGPERAALERFACENHLCDSVQFLGAKDNIEEYLRAFDVFVLPSITEGMSNTLLEAMATGLPIVATRVGGNGEIVKEGVTGVLVPSGNHQKLSERIRDYMSSEDLRTRHGSAARLLALESFSLDTMVNKYDCLYSSFFH